MLYVTYTLNALLMIALPIGLGFFLTRRFGLGWGLFWIGAATFVGSQAVHLPLNFGLTALFQAGLLPAPPPAYRLGFNAVVLGLTAGLAKSLVLYAAYRWWIKEARTWREATLFGVGHGGVSVITGGLSFIRFEYWPIPWYVSLLNVVQLVSILCLQLCLVVMVLQVFTRHNLLWLVAAIGWHALAEVVTMVGVSIWGIDVVDGILALFALASLAILFALRPRQEALPPQPEVIPGTPARPTRQPDSTDDLSRRLDESRYFDE